MDKGDREAAEKIFRYNMEVYPEAANPHDSYADYLIEVGETKEAKRYLQKSIEIAENSDKEDERTRIYPTSKSKLAKLNNKHRQLDFMNENWKVTDTQLNEDVEGNTFSGSDEFTYDEESMILTVHHKNENGSTRGKRFVVFDEINEEFDVAYISGLKHGYQEFQPKNDGINR